MIMLESLPVCYFELTNFTVTPSILKIFSFFKKGSVYKASTQIQIQPLFPKRLYSKRERGREIREGEGETERRPVCDHPYCLKAVYNISKEIWHGVLTYTNQLDTLKYTELPSQIKRFSPPQQFFKNAVLSTQKTLSEPCNTTPTLANHYFQFSFSSPT